MEKIELETFLPYQLVLAADALSQKTTTIAREKGNLNLSQWRVLAAIADKPGATAKQVVDVTPMDKGIVSRAVKSLIENSMVIRKASKTDGRIGHLSLSAKGERTYQKIATEIWRLHHNLERTVPELEYKQTLLFLKRVSEALRFEDE